MPKQGTAHTSDSSETAPTRRIFPSPPPSAANPGGDDTLPLPGPMEDEDRHGFVSAFVGSIRADGDQGRSGKRLVAIGGSLAVAVALGAVVIGAMSSGASAAAKGHNQAASSAAAHPSGAAAQPGTTSTNATTHTSSTFGTPGTAFVDTSGGSGTGTTSGSGTGTGTGRTSAKTQSGSAGMNQSRAGYSAIAGYGCSDSSTSFYAKDMYFNQGTAGWLQSSTGGYGGCADGTYLSEPMSGSATTYDTTQGVLWHFSLGSLKSATCQVSVYVPDNSDITRVGGNPAHYFLFAQEYKYGMNVTPAGTFTVAQVSHRGSWVAQSLFHVSSGTVVVKMVNTGVDFTSSTNHAHLAAAPVRLTCAAA